MADQADCQTGGGSKQHSRKTGAKNRYYLALDLCLLAFKFPLCEPLLNFCN